MCINLNNERNIRKRLLDEMRNGVFSECERLPRETVLSEKLGISRTQLRDVLSGLEQEGFITRRQGVGTVINHHVLQVKSRIDIETEFLDIIRHNGYEAEVSYVEAIEQMADEAIACKLKIPKGTAVIRVCRVCKADGKPALYCEDVFEKRFVKDDYILEDLKHPIFYFLEKHCDICAYMDLTEIHAVLADEVVSKVLNVSVGTPLLNFEEIDYDIDGNTIFYSRQYFVDELFEQTMLRKRL